MSDSPETEPAAASAKGWGVALAAALFVCVLCAVLFGPAQGGPWISAVVTAAFALAYAVFFALVVRRVRPHSAGAVVSVAGTAVAAVALTIAQPSSALFQFWAYPMLWTLFPRPRVALAASAVVAFAVFAAFGLTPHRAEDWAVTAALTQGVSFAVSAVMGLWITSVYRNAEERVRILRQLTDAQAELAVLQRDAGTTAERERLARELHDTLAQSLTGTVLLVQRARHDLASGRLDDDALAVLEESAHTALSETRTLVAQTAPVELGGGGLASALETLAERFRRESGIEVEVTVALPHPLDRETEVALLRCAQEGIGNVRKHAQASRVEIDLRAADGSAEVRVRDNGRGYDPAGAAEGYGLPGLRARLALAGGSLHLDGTPGRTELRARIPLGASS